MGLPVRRRPSQWHASAFNAICSSGDKRTRYFFAGMVDPLCPLPTATGENIPTSQFNRGQILVLPVMDTTPQAVSKLTQGRRGLARWQKTVSSVHY